MNQFYRCGHLHGILTGQTYYLHAISFLCTLIEIAFLLNLKKQALKTRKNDKNPLFLIKNNKKETDFWYQSRVFLDGHELAI